MFQNVLENLPGVDPNSEAVQQVIKINSQKTKFSNVGVFYGQCSEICGANHSFIPIAGHGGHDEEGGRGQEEEERRREEVIQRREFSYFARFLISLAATPSEFSWLLVALWNKFGNKIFSG